MKCRYSLAALSSVAFLYVCSHCPAQDPNTNSTARFEIPATDDGLPGAGPIRRYDWFRKL